MTLKALMAVPALAAIVAASAFMTGTAAAVTPNAINISVSKSSLHYNQKSLTAKPGKVTIYFTNNSKAQHNVSLEQGETEYGATLTIGKSATSTILTLAKGTYHFYSSVGKDEDRGMAGSLVVK